MKKILVAGVLALAALALAAPPSNAASLPKHTVKKSVDIAAPPAKVWDVVKNFGDLTWVSSIVKSSSATNGNNVGSVRTLELGGPHLTEQLTRYNADKMKYSYEIQDTANNKKVVPVSGYHSTISVKPGPNGGSTVTWRGTFSRADTSATPAASGNDDAAVKSITGIYETGLNDLKKKLGG